MSNLHGLYYTIINSMCFFTYYYPLLGLHIARAKTNCVSMCVNVTYTFFYAYIPIHFVQSLICEKKTPIFIYVFSLTQKI